MTKDKILELLSNKELPFVELVRLFELHKEDEQIVSKIAMNISMRTSVYDDKIGYDDEMPSLLAKIAKSGFMDARWAVAKVRHTPVEILDMLSQDNVNLVRALVATNPNTPVSTLEKLFSDEKIVRDGLSGNPNTPQKLLNILADDSDKMVRLRVVENPSTTKAILEKLQDDVEDSVKIAAKIRLEKESN